MKVFLFALFLSLLLQPMFGFADKVDHSSKELITLSDNANLAPLAVQSVNFDEGSLLPDSDMSVDNDLKHCHVCHASAVFFYNFSMAVSRHHPSKVEFAKQQFEPQSVTPDLRPPINALS